MTARTELLVGAVLAPLGIVLCLIAPEQLGAVATLAGLALMLHGLHRFGRGGPDAPERAPRGGKRGSVAQ